MDRRVPSVRSPAPRMGGPPAGARPPSRRGPGRRRPTARRTRRRRRSPARRGRQVQGRVVSGAGGPQDEDGVLGRTAGEPGEVAVRAEVVAGVVAAYGGAATGHDDGPAWEQRAQPGAVCGGAPSAIRQGSPRNAAAATAPRSRRNAPTMRRPEVSGAPGAWPGPGPRRPGAVCRRRSSGPARVREADGDEVDAAGEARVEVRARDVAADDPGAGRGVWGGAGVSGRSAGRGAGWRRPSPAYRCHWGGGGRRCRRRGASWRAPRGPVRPGRSPRPRRTRRWCG